MSLNSWKYNRRDCPKGHKFDVSVVIFQYTFICCTLILYILYIYTGVQFSFIPSQAITIQQTAVYKCSVDNNGVVVQWIVNGSSSIDSSIADLGIITYGAATQNSNLTIPGNLELNNTIVTCIAAGLVDMMGYFNTSSATLFIQGMPCGLCQYTYVINMT